MKDVRIIIDGEQDDLFFEVPEELSASEIEYAIQNTGLEVIGGRPKRP